MIHSPPPHTDPEPGEFHVGQALSAAVQDASGPVLGALSALFAFFAVFNYVDLPRQAVVPMVAHDLTLVIVFALGARTLSRRRLPAAWTHPAAVVVVALVLSNILLATGLLRDSFYTNYVLIVVVGIGALMLSSRWAIASLLLTFAAWAATVVGFTPLKQFVHLSFTVLGASALSLALHLTRKSTHIRLLELRGVDAQRKHALEQALRETERARDELDHRVEARTRELAGTNARLLQEIEQRARAQEGLRLADQVFASSTSAIVVTDTSNQIVRVNPAFTEMTGMTAEQALGSLWRTTVFVSELYDDAFFTRLEKALIESGRWEGESPRDAARARRFLRP